MVLLAHRRAGHTHCLEEEEDESRAQPAEEGRRAGSMLPEGVERMLLEEEEGMPLEEEEGMSLELVVGIPPEGSRLELGKDLAAVDKEHQAEKREGSASTGKALLCPRSALPYLYRN